MMNTASLKIVLHHYSDKSIYRKTSWWIFVLILYLYLSRGREEEENISDVLIFIKTIPFFMINQSAAKKYVIGFLYKIYFFIF